MIAHKQPSTSIAIQRLVGRGRDTAKWRSAMSGLVEAAKEVKEKGTFGFIERSLPTPEISRFMRE